MPATVLHEHGTWIRLSDIDLHRPSGLDPDTGNPPLGAPSDGRSELQDLLGGLQGHAAARRRAGAEVAR